MSKTQQYFAWGTLFLVVGSNSGDTFSAIAANVASIYFMVLVFIEGNK